MRRVRVFKIRLEIVFRIEFLSVFFDGNLSVVGWIFRLLCSFGIWNYFLEFFLGLSFFIYKLGMLVMLLRLVIRINGIIY